VNDHFTGQFTQQEPIGDEAIARAVEVLRSGRLHRYNTIGSEIGETAQLELDFRDYIGSRYCLAVTSGGYALATALRAAGVAHGTPVLTNAFTLAPVPGAIVAVGGRPVLVETTEELVIDLDDLLRKIASSGARVLLLSHMRGHIVDMDALATLCAGAGVTVIEDCAHTLGASWNGVKSGRHGLAACYSTQTYKHINSGEGGLLVSDDAELMARATVLSGSYMLYGRHPAGPAAACFEAIRLEMPNCSGRMDNLRAAILRPQLAQLDANVLRWNARYAAVEEEIGGLACIRLIARPAREHFVGSSIQFRLPGFSRLAVIDFLARCAARGVELKWFGGGEPVGFTSDHRSWRFVPSQCLPQTDRVLAGLCDMRLPLTFSVDDCRLIGRILRESALAVRPGSDGAGAAPLAPPRESR
jgi:dTDP-4-amino-4,6-dideoxygalactose transaminase